MEDETPVGDPAGGCNGITQHASPDRLRRRVDDQGSERQADEHRRHKSSGAMPPEPGEVDATAARPLGEEKCGDEEAGEREEDADAEMTTGQQAEVGVEDQHSPDGESP